MKKKINIWLTLVFLPLLLFALTSCGSVGVKYEGSSGSNTVTPSVEDGQLDVNVDAIITVTFTKAVDASTVNTSTLFVAPHSGTSENIADDLEPDLFLDESTGLCNPNSALPSTVGCYSETQCYIQPLSPFSESTTYDACVREGIRDIYGVEFPAKTVIFTTKSNASTSYTVGGTITGLTGTGLVLQNSSADDLSVAAASSSFTFATAVSTGSAYAVTVSTQPTTPSQTCTVTNGSGTISAANVTNVTVTCVTNQYTVGGTVSGLAEGNTAIIQNNGAEDYEVSNGAFMFETLWDDGSPYAVTVLTQPTSPSQTCVVTDGSGNINGANVTTVDITCTTNTYTIGGSVSGLAEGNSVVLQNNLADDKTVSANGAFTFATALDDQSAYSVTVLTQPTTPEQTCTVTSGSGSLAGANVTNVTVTCVTNQYTIGGTVSGLAGTGLVLQNNLADNKNIAADGAFTFATALDDQSAYSVTVLTQPTSLSQTCTVTNGSGTISAANVTNVTVTCVTNQYTVGGTVSGLAEGNTAIIQNNGAEDYEVSNGAFMFETLWDDGSPYAVTVLTQPTSPSQTCVVTDGSGNINGANVTTVDITCTTNTYTIGGSVSGLAEGNSVVLQNNLADDKTVSANDAFTFATALDDQSAYSVTVLTQPTTPSQTCTVTNGSGTISAANVTNVTVTCVTNQYTIGGTVSGLAGSGLVLQNNLADNKNIAADGAFTFATALDDQSAYSATVLTQPTSLSQTCTVTSGSGTIAGANVTNVTVTCVTNKFTIGGTLTGLTGGGSVTLQNNLADDESLSANGAFEFGTSLNDGSAYSVTVSVQPSDPVQVCTVTSGSGTLAGVNITNVSVSCSPTYVSCTGDPSIAQGTDFSEGDDLELNGTGTCTLTTAASLASLTIDAGVTLTHTATTGSINITTTGDITVNATAAISADAKGCPTEQGWLDGACSTSGDGKGTNDPYAGAGAGHGGVGGCGGSSSSCIASGGSVYGSATDPAEMGAGGGKATGNDLDGGSGGGIIKLISAGTIDLDGTISVNGGVGSTIWYGASGGGAGGSIYIDTNVLSGTGTITANGGGAAAEPNGYNGGSGGGGRIAIYFHSDSRTAAATLIGESTANAGTPASDTYKGKAGSIIYAYDPNDDSTPIPDGWTASAIDDDSIRIKGGHLFTRSDSGTLSIDPAALEVSSAESLSTSANVTSITLTFGTSDDALVTEKFTSNTLSCNSATASAFFFTGSSGNSNVRFVGNTISCESAAMTFNGFDSTTLNDTITTTSGDAGSISVTSSNNTGITFNAATYTAPSTATSDLNTFNISTTGNVILTGSAALTGNIDNSSVTDFDVDSGASWTGNFDMDGLTGISVIAGSISANAKGCPSQQGWLDSACSISGVGKGTNGSYGAAGGGHGGVGGCGSSVDECASIAGGATYGSATNPVEMGAGGGQATGTAKEGGAGGGLIRLTSTGTIDVDGTISANGENGPSTWYGTAGAGAGGGIYINTNILSGTGTLTTTGGNASVEPYYGGSGGGGRIAIDINTYSEGSTVCAGSTSAHGTAADPTFDGEDGTVNLTGCE